MYGQHWGTYSFLKSGVIWKQEAPTVAQIGNCKVDMSAMRIFYDNISDID